MKRIILFSIIIALLLSNVASADFYSDNDILFYDRDAVGAICNSTQSRPILSGSSSGASFWADGDIQKIEEYKSVYEQAAKVADIPWEMLAVLHKRETGLGLTNPGNGQGLYQFFAEAGQYPPGTVDQAEFLRQTTLAAQRLQSDYAKRGVVSGPLSATTIDPRKVKDIFFSYNGRAEFYANQAATLGFDQTTDPFEGSPYVMNLADAQRDSKTNPNWRQYLSDGGNIGPANRQPGAFVLFAELRGIDIASSCGTTGSPISGTTLEKIVTIAKAEFDKKPIEYDATVLGYTNGNKYAWCASFTSWVYDQAGVGFGYYPSVAGQRQAFQKSNSTLSYQSLSATTQLQEGDIIFWNMGKTDWSHLGIVYGVNGEFYQVISGNYGDTVALSNHKLGDGTHDAIGRLK